jgi:hypothetical protein
MQRVRYPSLLWAFDHDITAEEAKLKMATLHCVWSPVPDLRALGEFVHALT